MAALAQHEVLAIARRLDVRTQTLLVMDVTNHRINRVAARLQRFGPHARGLRPRTSFTLMFKFHVMARAMLRARGLPPRARSMARSQKMLRARRTLPRAGSIAGLVPEFHRLCLVVTERGSLA